MLNHRFFNISLFLIAITFTSFAKAKSLENLKMNSPVEKHTVFRAGEDNVNTYRIPSLIVANDSSIIVFGEARRISWRDKSRTDIVAKRSTDNGKTWSDMTDLTKGTTGAYMDPTPVIDKTTGKIFLFCNFWPENDHSGKTNRSILVTSEDNGKSWSEPEDVTDNLLTSDLWSMGFGPGNGFQIKDGKYSGRLIMPMRLANASDGKGFDIALYSDDHGKTWKRGNAAEANNEFQIAQVNNDTLIYNSRHGSVRNVARSYDGGVNWTKEYTETNLPGVSHGCQASIFGINGDLYFCGIDGIPMTDDFDERARLAIYRSRDGGYSWPESKVLYEKASGYACIDELPDGRLAIIFESGETDGFTRKSVPGIDPPQRPADWMNLDLLIIDPVASAE